jgi:hypothetical protein
MNRRSVLGYAKLLLYRNPDLTNVYVQPYYSMYDYAVLGLTTQDVPDARIG